MKVAIQNYLNEHISENAKIIEIKKSNKPLKFVRYGLKKFQELNIRYKINKQEYALKLIIKKYPVIDVPMMISKDTNYREIQFFSADIKKIFSRFFDIPALFVDTRAVFMRDFVIDKKQFGPPILPTKEQLKVLITRTAIKDAKLAGQNWEYACQFQDIFDFMYRTLTDALTQQEAAHLKKEWPWFQSCLKRFLKQIGSARLDKIKTKFSPAKMKRFLKSVPFTLHHGDFFYANIGFNEKLKPMVINWEMLSYAPIGYDFVTLTKDIPPLDFCDCYEEWYVEAYNNACDNPITVKSFTNIAEKLINFQFMAINTLEMLYEHKWTDEMGKQEREAKMKYFIDRLDSVLTQS